MRVRGVLLILLCSCVWAAPVDADEEPAAGDDPIQELPPIEIRAPRIHAPPRVPDIVPTTETALRQRRPAFDVPAAVSVLEGAELTGHRMVRSMPDALRGLTGVMVQKTAPLQASPIIRGFTGYQNLLLIDGVRLNHSAFRAGPNQYWSTVDAYTIRRLEVVRGPHSVLYGSDAVGGTVNALPWKRKSFEPGTHVNGGLRVRGATAERAAATRVQFEGNVDNVGWFGGVTYRHYGDIQSGAGRLPMTGGIDELDADLRIDHRLSPRWTATAAWQHVRQYDASRTERTTASVPFRGTEPGAELRRDFDQERDLLYGRLVYDAGRDEATIRRAKMTVSWHRHEERRDRLRTMGREDLSGFVLDQLGVQVQAESGSRIGDLTYGIEYHHDDVRSFRRDFRDGAFRGSQVQGPIGDQATYDLLGIYVQDQVSFGRFDLIAGGRFTYAAASADRVDNAAVAGTDPATPGNVISIDDDWTSLVGSLRVVAHVSPRWNVYAGLSQAFRAPSLHDLTSLDTTSVVETPSPGLDPERYVSAELGVKTEQDLVTAEGALWVTWLDDAVIRSPTGALIDGTPEVRKDNIGDGWAWGFELEAAARIGRVLTGFGGLSWMDAEVDELDAATGTLVTSPLSRMKPFTISAGLRLEPPGAKWWAEGRVRWSAREDRLSLRDRADTRRIPAGGTPSYTLLDLRGGVELWKGKRLTLALENLLDENYRVHGSGQNEPGRSLVVAFEADL